ncbi:hypothetical protein PVK06_042651 [Gossypium arboreum]|uniref:Uncharacterized protein n=1 Tax=Gossypium arboreum TaxID=29729 RepID=A0ABR0MLU0_GOSAR|nr:hypothetical protein PVK06_042651 [Gossypium arboreum]
MAALYLVASKNLVFSGSTDNSVCVWRREYGGIHSCVSILTGHVGLIKCLAIE